MRLTVIGCGYLGATHAACMAELGHDVIGVEADPTKLQLLEKGEIGFYEPGLQELLQRHVASGRLRFTSSVEEAAETGDVHFICVGTPQRSDNYGADLSYLDAAIDSLAPNARSGSLIVGKSTVPVGTADRLAARIDELVGAHDLVHLAWNPEFLREGYAIADTLTPDRLVFGSTNTEAERLLNGVYRIAIQRGTPVVSTDFATAELAKVAANAFLATKISFINAVAEVCEVAGGDVNDLADAIGLDDRIGRKFLNAGIGFGGGCLPKDIRAFLHRAGELGVDDVMSFLREVDAINLHRRQRAVTTATAMLSGNASKAQVAVLGASFKPNSDDIRDSPALWAAGQLQLAGANVRVYDPKAMESAKALFPTLNYANDVDSACEGADLVLHLTEWQEFRRLDPVQLGEVVAQKRMLDGRNVLASKDWRAAGWEFRSLGGR